MAVMIIQDGQDLKFEDWKESNPTGLIVNTASKKVHRPGCLNMKPFKKPGRNQRARPSMTTKKKLCFSIRESMEAEYKQLVQAGEIDCPWSELCWMCKNCAPLSNLATGRRPR